MLQYNILEYNMTELEKKLNKYLEDFETIDLSKYDNDELIKNIHMKKMKKKYINTELLQDDNEREVFETFLKKLKELKNRIRNKTYYHKIKNRDDFKNKTKIYNNKYYTKNREEIIKRQEIIRKNKNNEEKYDKINKLLDIL